MNLSVQCPNASLKLLGDYWSLAIIQELQAGERRFCEIERTLTGINPTTLSGRLKKLEHTKLVRRETVSDDRRAVIYTLTDKGLAVLPIIKDIADFARRFEP